MIEIDSSKLRNRERDFENCYRMNALLSYQNSWIFWRTPLATTVIRTLKFFRTLKFYGLTQGMKRGIRVCGITMLKND